MIGQTLSHYRITDALGAGAMGEVYRATDTKLGRDVALKVLPTELAESPERLERFRREAQALAALDHPGIVTVHSVEEADGVHFLTMQLVEGRSLDELVVEGGMPVDRIRAIATPLAEALTAAHAKGIVHRDLKPANVMVSHDGRVKVLDFGLAKMAPSADDTGSADLQSQLPTQLQTRDGAVMGTVPYMSPEQVSGRPLDSRTDLFSFGVLLYEMATGRRPFEGESSAELASAILRDTPTPPSELRDDLPEGLNHLIVRSLEKAPEARYDSAEQLLAELHGGSGASHSGRVASKTTDSGEPNRYRRSWLVAALIFVTVAVSALFVFLGPLRRGSASSSPAALSESSPSIAVLPFDNLSGDPDQEYFSDGMAEEVLNALSSVSGLRVAARTSAFSFKGKSVDVREVGQKLDVDHVLEGSVRRSGSQLRINAQLVSAEDGYQLWSDVFDREMTDVFEVQEEIAQAIVGALRGQLDLEVEASSLVRPGTDDLEAYNAYLRGRSRMAASTAKANRQSIGDFEEAVAADPQFADAWGALALAWELESVWTPFEEVAGPLEEASDRALALDPEQPAGLVAKAWHIARSSWDWRAAEDLYLRGMEKIERDVIALDVYGGNQLGPTGRTDQAVELVRGALERDPFNQLLRSDLTWHLLTAGRADEGLIAAEELLAIVPDYPQGLVYRAWALTQAGRLDELREALELLPDDDDEMLWVRIPAYHALGDLATVERLTDRLRDLGPSRLSSLAWVLIGTGQIEEGLTALEESVDGGSFLIVYSRAFPRVFDPALWQNPRFQAVLERMRLDDESLREQGFEVEAR